MVSELIHERKKPLNCTSALTQAKEAVWSCGGQCMAETVLLHDH